MAKHLPKCITRKQAQQLLAQVDFSTPTGARNRAALELMYRCGLRAAEVCDLRRSEILWDESKVLVANGKGNRDRYVPYDAETDQWLRNWDKQRHGHCPWFLHTVKRTTKSKRHTQWSTRSLRAMVQRYAEKAGLAELGISPHTLRHTYATECLQDGANPLQVQKLLGHSNLNTTMIYTHVVDGELEEFIRGRAQQKSLADAPSAGALCMGKLMEELGITPDKLQGAAEKLGLVGEE